ncbi:hypothetical protein QYE76_005908 [Lolium multiflorum]|uniref:Uncharacterized protein n=1 Tax=Lolium multiflorum TaxID=4521 RepID=A0AAD8W3L3_LOLMU|nr:hypothetical protein QYE76_005908 [Lolium multiflorum]
MTGRFDPTWITTFRLSKADVVAKAKQICKTKMLVEWKWGLEPHSRRRPPAPQNFARISAEQPDSFTPNRTEEDMEDPDPFRTTPVHATDSSRNMGSGNSSAFPSSRTRADESGSKEDDCVILEAAVAQPTCSQSLTLHAGRAAVAVSEKILAQTGRIIELNRGEANLGSLQKYVDEWNLSDMTEATLGLGKDGQLVVDSRGPWNTVQHMYRLKHSMREFDNAWHDVDKNVHGVLDSCKKVFEKLLWEHRDLTEAFTALQLTHSQCQAALPEAPLQDELIGQIAALQAEKDKLALQHQNALQAQKNETARLKEELIQAGLRHDSALKEAIKAGKAEVEEAKDQLRQELEEEKKLRRLEKERNNKLQLLQTSCGEFIKELDDKARRTCRSGRCQSTAPDASSPWTTEDYMTALSSRITHMKKLAKLPDAAIKAFKCLWPEEPVPDRVGSIASQLLESGKRLSEWRRSASRAGADTTLQFVCSWYEDLDLDTLTTIRGDAPTNTQSRLPSAVTGLIALLIMPPPTLLYRLLLISRMNSLMMKLKMMKTKRLKKPLPPMTKLLQLAKFRRAPLRNMHEKLYSCL